MLEEARREAARLKQALESHGVRVEAIYLFGSIARGDFRADSDFDFIIVSRDWGRMPYLERLGLLYRLWSGERDATLIPLTPEELRSRVEKSVALRDASRYWIRVA